MREESTSVISYKTEARSPALCKQQLAPALPRPGNSKSKKRGADPAPLPKRSARVAWARGAASACTGHGPRPGKALPACGRPLRLPEWGRSGPSPLPSPGHSYTSSNSPHFARPGRGGRRCPRGEARGRRPGGRLTEQRAYEDDDLHGGGEVAVQLRLAQLPGSAAVGGAGRVARLAGVPGDPAAVVPHGEAGAPALLAARPPARQPPWSPASVSPVPGAEGPAGAGRSPGEPGAASGPLTTPHRQPRRLGGGEGER